MKHNLILAAAIGISILTGCKKDALDEKQQPGSNEGNVVYQLTTNDENTGGRSTNQFAFTSGQATLSEIKFDAKGDDRVVYKSKTVQTINLFNAINTLGSLTIPQGTYDKIKLKIRFEPTSTAPALELGGNYTSTTGTQVPVVLRVTNPFEAKFDIKETVTIDNNTNLTMLSTLALSSLTSRVTQQMLNDADRDNNGVIVISKTSNSNLYNRMWDVLEDMLNVKVKKK